MGESVCCGTNVGEVLTIFPPLHNPSCCCMLQLLSEDEKSGKIIEISGHEIIMLRKSYNEDRTKKTFFT